MTIIDVSELFCQNKHSSHKLYLNLDNVLMFNNLIYDESQGHKVPHLSYQLWIDAGVSRCFNPKMDHTYYTTSNRYSNCITICEVSDKQLYNIIDRYVKSKLQSAEMQATS